LPVAAGDPKSSSNDLVVTAAQQSPSGQNSPEGDGLLKRNDLDTTLLLHLFGKDGNLSLSFEEFARFMQNLQTEVLELEFQEFSKGDAFGTFIFYTIKS
jgi:hypothetical protein